MPDVEISYKGSQIASMSASGVKTLLTGDSFCEDDIAVKYTKPSATLQSKSITPTESAQTVTADPGYDGLSQVNVGRIPTNYIVPSGTKTITENGTGIDVANYATVDVNVSGGGGDTATVSFDNVNPSTDHIYYVDTNGSLQEAAPSVPFICPSKSLIVVVVKLLQPGISVLATGATLKTTISNGSRAIYQYNYLFQAN